MSGPRPQIIICTNFSSSPTAPALIRAALSTHYRQPTVLHLWLSFSQTREILRRGAKTRDKASCERVNGAGTPRGEGGCYVRSNVVRRVWGRWGLVTTVRHFIMWTQTSGGAGWPIWWADTRPSAHQEMLDTFQENNQQSQLLVWHSVKCSSSSF